MAATKPDKLTFHVAQEASPDHLIPILETLNTVPAPGPSDSAALYEMVQARYGMETTPRPEPITLAVDLGLITRSSGLQLTPRGRAVVKLRPPRQADVLHYLLYTAWDSATPELLSDLWSYRTVCDELWTRQEGDLNGLSKTLVEDVINRSQIVFDGVPGYNANDVSFSGKSVRGVRKWLEALSPPVLDGQRFIRRSTCSDRLLILAIGYMHRSTEAELGVDLLLTAERRTAICKVALLDPATLDRLLDWIIPIYPRFLVAGTRTGSYGRFLRLLEIPTVEDVA
jgi:hypothetical protein